MSAKSKRKPAGKEGGTLEKEIFGNFLLLMTSVRQIREEHSLGLQG